MPGDLRTAPRIISLSPLSLATDVTDATLGASDLWLGTRTGAGGTATLTETFFGRSPWLHGQLGVGNYKTSQRIRKNYIEVTLIKPVENKREIQKVFLCKLFVSLNSEHHLGTEFSLGRLFLCLLRNALLVISGPPYEQIHNYLTNH